MELYEVGGNKTLQDIVENDEVLSPAVSFILNQKTALWRMSDQKIYSVNFFNFFFFKEFCVLAGVIKYVLL